MPDKGKCFLRAFTLGEDGSEVSDRSRPGGACGCTCASGGDLCETGSCAPKPGTHDSRAHDIASCLPRRLAQREGAHLRLLKYFVPTHYRNGLLLPGGETTISSKESRIEQRWRKHGFQRTSDEPNWRSPSGTISTHTHTHSRAHARTYVHDTLTHRQEEHRHYSHNYVHTCFSDTQKYAHSATCFRSEGSVCSRGPASRRKGPKESVCRSMRLLD